MGFYSNFMGIDIGKFNIVIAVCGEKDIKEYPNSKQGIKNFIKDYKKYFPNILCVLEATGGYETLCLEALCDKEIPVHRAHSKNVKNFINSYGHGYKTDSLDAKALALYAKERCKSLRLYQMPGEASAELNELVTRRQELTKMLVAEKNRLQGPKTRFIKKSCESVIRNLEQEKKAITNRINALMASDEELTAKQKILRSMPGIGPVLSTELLVLLPELGHVNRRQIASLTGTAPKAKDSGKHKGYRRTGYGRSGVKPCLFLSAMAARSSNSDLKDYYMQLRGRGKKKMVALTALMRKILVRANAKIRDYYLSEADLVLAIK